LKIHNSYLNNKDNWDLLQSVNSGTSYQESYFWNKISCQEGLSEDFIKEFKDKLDWHYISRCQILSESFIEQFKKKVDWNAISICQKLSHNFIKKFNKNINHDLYKAINYFNENRNL
jgi:hypothetical protein